MAAHLCAGIFHKLGFQTVGIDTLPERSGGVREVYKYNNCDETAVVLELR